MLFGCQHQDGNAERGSDEHLDENALSGIDIRGKHRAKVGRLAEVVVPLIVGKGKSDSNENGKREKEIEGRGRRVVQGQQASNNTYLYATGPGVSANTMPAAAMAPVNCAMQYSTNRVGRMQPRRRRARLTSGLKSPPVARKKSQADTSMLSPKAVAM